MNDNFTESFLKLQAIVSQLWNLLMQHKLRGHWVHWLRVSQVSIKNTLTY